MSNSLRTLKDHDSSLRAASNIMLLNSLMYVVVFRRARKAGLPLIIDGDGLYIINQNLKLIKGYTVC
jgi:hypothetical protein